jgi:hypothetical protein
MICSNRCGKQQGEASGKCAREREERDDRWEETRASHRVGFDDLRRQYCGAPTRDFTGLAASLEELEEGKQRGERGLFIGVARGLIGKELKGRGNHAGEACAGVTVGA